MYKNAAASADNKTAPLWSLQAGCDFKMMQKFYNMVIKPFNLY